MFKNKLCNNVFICFTEIFVLASLIYSIHNYTLENLHLQIILTLTLILTNTLRSKAYNTIFIGFDLPLFICMFFIMRGIPAVPIIICFVIDNVQRIIRKQNLGIKRHYKAVCRRLFPLFITVFAFNLLLLRSDIIEFVVILSVVFFALANIISLEVYLRETSMISIFTILNHRWLILFYVLHAFFSIAMIKLYSHFGLIGSYLGFCLSIYVYMLLKESIYIEKHQVTYRETLKMFVDYFDYGILILDQEHTILSINKKLIEENNLNSVMVVGTKYCEYKENFKHHNYIDQIITALKDKESFLEIFFNVEDRQFSVTGVKTDSIEGPRYTIVLRDTTVKQLKNLEMLTKKKLESLEQLAAGTANDIKNPLAIAQGFLQLIRKSSEDQKQNYYTDQALKALAETDSFIELFALLGNPAKDHHKYKAINFTALISEIVEDNRDNIITNNHIEIHTSLEENVELTGNEKLLSRALRFIIKNSIDAITDKGEINVNLTSSKDFIELEIQDNGSGIEPENLPKVFDPYFTTKIDDSKGLSLFYCKKIVDQHNGTISIQSISGNGTKVIIKLPK